jgi:hypothetical protein
MYVEEARQGDWAVQSLHDTAQVITECPTGDCPHSEGHRRTFEVRAPNGQLARAVEN